MTDEEKIRKNKIILTVFALTFVLIVVIYALSNCTFNGTFYFRYCLNQKTGEPAGFFASIIVYLFFGWLIVVVFWSIICVSLLMPLYLFLHRKDKQRSYFSYISYRSYQSHDEKFDVELYYAASITQKVVFITVLVLMLFHIFNIVTFHLL